MKMTVRNIEVQGKKVLVRVDFNVPMDDDGRITDDTRIREALPTIRYLLEKGASVVLMSHLGRPKGRPDERFRLAPVGARLGELLGRRVESLPDCVGDQVEQRIADLGPGEIVLLENLRFHEEEEANDAQFARRLARLGEVYVNDAFGAAHRAHASTAGVARYLPAVSGFLVQKEIEIMGNALSHPERPFVAILGGKKVKDKIGVIRNLLGLVDELIIGGGMAYTFLKAKGCEVGDSLLDPDGVEVARGLMVEAERRRVPLLLPKDVVVARAFSEEAPRQVVVSDAIPVGWQGLDIGPATRELFAERVAVAKTVVWNGPLGVFEMDAFAPGTQAVARALAESRGVTIIGGGDTAAAVQKAGVAGRMTHISTGGGASLEFLEGRELPGVCALDDRRTPILAANWKMNKTRSEAREFCAELRRAFSELDASQPYPVEVVVCPPFTALDATREALSGSSVALGAQDLYWESRGAYTGEIAPGMLTDVGCTYVIVGHSERRQHFGETNESVGRKTGAALLSGLRPIVCVGETLAQRREGSTEEVVRTQILEGLGSLPVELADRLVIAYEPVWAIGTGENATGSEANRCIGLIRGALGELFGPRKAAGIRVQYGGSVNPSNILEFLAEPEIDGALVGGASLTADSLGLLVKAAAAREVGEGWMANQGPAVGESRRANGCREDGAGAGLVSGEGQEAGGGPAGGRSQQAGTGQAACSGVAGS